MKAKKAKTEIYVNVKGHNSKADIQKSRDTAYAIPRLAYKYQENFSLSLALVDVERSDCLALLLWQSYFSELVLILGNVLLKSQKQTLCMLRSQNHTAVDDCLWQTWQNACEVSDEF